jgi:hypothetical protein
MRQGENIFWTIDHSCENYFFATTYLKHILKWGLKAGMMFIDIAITHQDAQEYLVR